MHDTGINFRTEGGVLISESAIARFKEFEQNYLAVRGKEGRVISLDEIKRLPNVSRQSVDFSLWEKRKKSIKRLLNYLAKKNRSTVLDIGCGNGFFTNLIRQQAHDVTGIDANLFELKQAAEAFSGSGIQWLYADIFDEQLPLKPVDIITFCASFQYFKDAEQTLKRCLSLLKKGGEIHIIDTPFYNAEESGNAKQRTKEYYERLEASDMTAFYHHHTYSSIRSFDFFFKYKPGILQKIFRDSPFPWIMIKNT